jgi:hypothetical protein
MGKVFPKLMILPLTATTMQSVSRMFEHGDGRLSISSMLETYLLELLFAMGKLSRKYTTGGGASGDVDAPKAQNTWRGVGRCCCRGTKLLVWSKVEAGHPICSCTSRKNLDSPTFL